MSTFENYAPWYDLLYLDKDYQGEADFIDRRLRRHLPDGGRLLDLGAGTGIHALAMAGRGWRVVGVDLSAAMIRRARRRLADHPELAARVSFHEGDAREIGADGGYDAVTALFHVVSYQTTLDDLSRMLAAARHALRPGGVFFFDYWYGAAVLAQGVETRVKSVLGDDLRVTRIASSRVDEATATVKVDYTLFCENTADRTIVRVDETHLMRYWFPFEIQALLERNGFATVGHFAWLTDSPPTSAHWAAYTVAVAV